MGGYNYEQDPDWQEALRRLQPQPEPEAPPPSAAQAQSPGIWAQAQDLLQKRIAAADAQQRELPAAEPPPAKDDAKTYWAMALSLLGNHGRDLGSILQASSDEYNHRLAAWESRQGRLRELQARGGAQQDPLQQLIALGNLDARNAGLKGVQDRAEHGWQQAESPDSAKQTTAVEVAKRKAAAGVEGRELEKNELKDLSADTAATISGARTTANTESKNQTPADITPAEQARLELQAQQLEESKRGRAVSEGIRADTERQRQTNDFNDRYGAAIEALSAAKTLEQLIGDKGDIAGVGPVVSSRFMPDALKSDEAIKEQQAFAAFQNPGFLARSGKVVTPAEAPRLEAEFGKLSSTNPEVVRNAVKAISETMRNTLRRAAVGREDIAREVLASQQLDDVLGPVAVADDAPPSARDAIPQTGPRPGVDLRKDTITGDPSNLGDTGASRSRVPAIPADARQGGAQTLKLPSGRTIRANLTPEQLQKAIAGGAELL